MDKYVLGVLVKNHFGVLVRVASMFRRRGFNIDTLTVGETEDREYSRITLTFSGDDGIKNQIIRQLNKMPDIVRIVELSHSNSVSRELVLIKINNNKAYKQDILSIVDIFRAKVIDYGAESLTVEITGESSKIDAFIELVKEYGIIEICRTGIVALQRGADNILSNMNEIN